MTSYAVTVTDGSGKRSTRTFAKTGLSIGSTPDNDVVLTGANIHRHHAVINFGERYGGCTISCDVIVNGVHNQRTLDDGDVIAIGDFALTLEGVRAYLASIRPPPPPPPPARVVWTPGSVSVARGDGILEVGLQRHGGKGSDLVSWSLSADGSARSEHGWIAPLKRFRGAVAREDFARLASQATSTSFLSFADTYGEHGGCSDVRYTRIVMHGMQKTVCAVGNSGPAELALLESAIRDIAAAISWTPDAG